MVGLFQSWLGQDNVDLPTYTIILISIIIISYVILMFYYFSSMTSKK